MDRIAALEAFVAVVDAGSFARAAGRLGLSTSACSRLVADLEARLDARLLNRTTRSLSLTEPGRALLERARQLLADFAEAEALAQAGRVRARGTLRVSAPVIFGVRHLAPLIAPFQKRHPEVRLDLALADRKVDLVEEGFDLAVRIGSVDSPALIARPLGLTTILACAAPAYLKRRGVPRTPADLARHDCLIYTHLPVRGEWRFTAPDGRALRARVQGAVESNHSDLLVAAAVQGLGICCEPDFAVGPDLEAGRLVRVLADHAPPSAPIHAVYASRRQLSAKVRAYVDFLAEVLAPRFGQARAGARRG
jgi:DNA-binding transcriptional LysR family regulator